MTGRHWKTVLSAGVAVAGVVASMPAMAQDAADIVVTARRTEERLQDVPISITVFNQEQLQKHDIAVASDLAVYTPSLSVNTRFGPEKATFSIRGFNQDAAAAPTVGVYFADVVGVRAQGGTAFSLLNFNAALNNIGGSGLDVSASSPTPQTRSTGSPAAAALNRPASSTLPMPSRGCTVFAYATASASKPLHR